MRTTVIGVVAAWIGFAMWCFGLPHAIGWWLSWLLLAFLVAILFIALPAHMARLENDAAEYSDSDRG